MARFVTVLSVVVLCLGWNLPDHAATRDGSAEHVFAECMRGRGFQYDTDAPAAHRPPILTRAERAKYGYYVFAALVYPGYWEEDPVNDAYRAALSHAQIEAYSQTSQACYAVTVKKFWHVNVTSVSDHVQHFSAALNAGMRPLDDDPQLVALARSYAGCMAAKGFPLFTSRPSLVSDAEERRFSRIADRLGRMQNPGAKPGLDYLPDMSPGEARPYLDKEVRSAVTDEECGRAFRQVYEPQVARIRQRVEAEWGVPGL